MRISQQHARNHVVTGSGVSRFAAQFFAPELRAWRGQQPLWKVFWLYGVATSCALIAIYVFAFLSERAALRQILVLCFAPYTAWILVSIWRCSNNESFWSLLARIFNGCLGVQHNNDRCICRDESDYALRPRILKLAPSQIQKLQMKHAQNLFRFNCADRFPAIGAI